MIVKKSDVFSFELIVADRIHPVFIYSPSAVTTRSPITRHDSSGLGVCIGKLHMLGGEAVSLG